MNKKQILLLFLVAFFVLLTSSCKKTTERPPFLPPPETGAPSDIGVRVRTDYSNLTPYTPPHSRYARLRDGILPDLVPSDDYGMLLPYANAAVLDDGGLREIKYGFVAATGVIVTDLVYDGLERAQSPHMLDMKPQPAYKVSRVIPGTETVWGAQSIYAACALDGSWITAFDYSDIIFTEEEIVMLRSYDSFDIDVYGYDGKLKYNMLDLEWTGSVMDGTWPNALIYSITEGYGNILMSDGTYAYIEIQTGQARYTGYTGAFPFSNGLAAVSERLEGHGEYPELWGFIDRSFRLAIPAQYVDPATFVGGRAPVVTPGGMRQVIDTRGVALLSIPKGYIEQYYNGSGFAIHPESGVAIPKLYTIGLEEIIIPETARDPDNAYLYMYPLDNGWYYYEAEDGAVLFTRENNYYIPGARGITYADGEYVICYDNNSLNSYFVTTIDGEAIIPQEPDTTITPVTDGGVIQAFIANTGPPVFFYFQGPYMRSTYRLYDTRGNIITSGGGRLLYDEAAGLYSVLSTDYFAWFDKDAKMIVSIPFLSNTFD